jgi:hypothetical protein
MIDFVVVLLRTSTAALRAEKLLTRAGVPVRLVPVPRQFSFTCGVALRIQWSQRDLAERVLQEAGLEVAGVHEAGGRC